MTDATAPDLSASDPSESAPTIERTSVLAVGDLDAHDVRRALAQLAALRGPTLAPLVRSTSAPGGVALTHRVPAGAVTLASLRTGGPLRAGQVLAVGVAVLEALVVVHGAGLAHGEVTGESVLVGPDGSVVLAATGGAWRVAPGEPDGPSRAGDVADVGELVRDLLGPGSAPAALVVAVVRAVDPDLALRPTAGGLLDLLRRSGRADSLLDVLWAPRRDDTVGTVAPEREPPEPAISAGDGIHNAVPVRAPALSAGTLRPTSRPPGRLAPRRRGSRAATPGNAESSRRTITQGRLFAVVLLAVLGASAAYGALSRGVAVDPPTAAAAATQAAAPPSPTATPTALSSTTPATLVSGAAKSTASAPPSIEPPDPAVPAEVDWGVVLSEIDRGRTAALTSGSTARLAAWVTGTAYAADLALTRAIEASGARLEGGDLVLEAVDPISVGPSTAVLRVRDRRTEYAVVVPGTRQTVPERAARTWTVTLARGGSPLRWRIAEVVDAALSPGGRR